MEGIDYALLRRREILSQYSTLDTLNFPTATWSYTKPNGLTSNGTWENIAMVNTNLAWSEFCDRPMTIACCAAWGTHENAWQHGLWGSHSGATGGMQENRTATDEQFWLANDFWFSVPNSLLSNKSTVVITTEGTGGVARIYVNGSLRESNSGFGGCSVGDYITLFKDGFWGRPFKGTFWDWRICKVTATPEDVTSYHRYFTKSLA